MVKKILALFLAVLTITILLTGCAKTTAASAYGTLKVTVYGLDHQPLSGAKVVSDSQPDGQLKVTGLTDTNGTVLFQNIKTGEYDFYISRFDYNQTQMDTTVRPGQTTEVPVYMNATNPVPTSTTTSQLKEREIKPSRKFCLNLEQLFEVVCGFNRADDRKAEFIPNQQFFSDGAHFFGSNFFDNRHNFFYIHNTAVKDLLTADPAGDAAAVFHAE